MRLFIFSILLNREPQRTHHLAHRLQLAHAQLDVYQVRLHFAVHLIYAIRMRLRSMLNIVSVSVVNLSMDQGQHTARRAMDLIHLIPATQLITKRLTNMPLTISQLIKLKCGIKKRNSFNLFFIF